MTKSGHFLTTGWGRGLILFLLVYSVFHLGSSIARYNPYRVPEVSGDFHRIYDETLAFKQHWQQTGELPVIQGFRVYHGLPVYLMLMPFTDLGFAAIDHFFYLIQFLLFPLALLLLLIAACPDSSPGWTEIGLACILLFNFKPFLEAFALHKMEGIELFLVAVALVAFKNRKDFLTGALLLAAASLKYLPGILLIYFLLKRETKVLMGAVAAGVVFLIFLLAVFGPQSMEALLVHPFHLVTKSAGIESNIHAANIEWQTVSGTINRWFAPKPTGDFSQWLGVGFAYPLTRPGLAMGIALFFKILLGAIYLFLIRHRWTVDQRKEKWPLYWLEISLTFLMLMVWIQAIRTSYAIFLLPGYLGALVLFARQWDLFRLKEKIFFGLSYALGATLIPMGVVDKLFPHPTWGPIYAKLYYWWGLPFYGFMLLGACLLLCTRRLAVRG